MTQSQHALRDRATWMRAAALAIVIALSILAVVPLQRADSDRSDWMAQLDDTAPLHTLTIPGTHDSGALYSFGDVFGKCQTLTVADQLKIGVRFLDIRLQLVGDELKIVHSFVDQKTDFRDTMTDMVTFLREHPTEFLLVSIKEDAAPKRAEADFTERLEEMLLAYPDVVSPATVLPATVGDARGKLHVIARYDGSTVGVPCRNGWKDDASFVLNDMYIQDNYQIGNTGAKFYDILTAFEVASAGEYALVLNYTSCYLSPSFPPVYAGLPAHDIRSWLKESIPLIHEPLGVLVCDFMTSDLADIIIRRNFE